MSEFRIDTELNLKTDKAKQQLNQLKNEAKKPITTNLDVKVNYKESKKNAKDSYEKKAKKDVQKGLDLYRKLANEANKIQTQINKGTLKGEQLDRAYKRLNDLNNRAKEIRKGLDEGTALELFDESQMTKNLQAFNKIEKGLDSITKKSKKLDKNLFGSAFDDIAKRSEQIRKVADSASLAGIPLDGSALDVKALNEHIDGMLKRQKIHDDFVKSVNSTKDTLGNMGYLGKDVEGYYKKLEKLSKKAAEDTVNGKSLDGYFDSLKSMNKELGGIQNAHKDLNGFLKTSGKLADRISNLNKSMFDSKTKSGLKSELEDIQKSAKETAKEGLPLDNEIKKYKSLMDKVGGFEKGTKDVQKIGSELSKITDKEVKIKLDLVGEKVIDDLFKQKSEIMGDAINKVNEGLSPNDELRKAKDLSSYVDNILKGQDDFDKLDRSLNDIYNNLSKSDMFDTNQLKEYKHQMDGIRDKALENLKAGKSLNEQFKDADYLKSEAKEGRKNLSSLEKFKSKVANLKDKVINLDVNVIGEEKIQSLMDSITKAEEQTLKNAKRSKNKDTSIKHGMEKLSEIGSDISNTEDSIKDFNKLNSYIEKLNNEVIKLDVDIIGEEQIEKLKESIESVKQSAKEDLSGDFLKNSKEKLSGIKDEIFNKKQAIKDFNKIDNLTEKLGNKVIQLDVNVIGEEQIEKLKSELNSIKESAKINIQADASLDNQFNQLDAYKHKINNMNELSEIQRSFNDIVEHGDSKMSFDNIRQSFNDAYHSISQISDLSGQASATRGLDNISSSLGRFEVRMSEVGNKRKLFGGILSDLNHGLRQISLGDFIGDTIYDSVYGLARGYAELDESMANLKKVADPIDVSSVKQLDDIRRKAVQISKDVGMSTTDVQNAIAASLQAGVGGMKESIAVARDSMILANVGDMSQTDASKALNSIIAGFNIDPLKTKAIATDMKGITKETTELANAMDVLNYAGNNYAIGTDGVAEALKRGGSVLHQYGLGIEESTAMITAANESIQDPAKVGNGLKSLAINFAGMKANAKDGSLSLNKTAMALKSIAGIDVMENAETGELKDMVSILDELHGKWGDLTDAQQKGLSEAVAGKHQAAIFQSLMGNYETFKKMRSEFDSGMHFGSAERENEQYVNSLAGKLNKLKTTSMDTFSTIFNSNDAYRFLDTVNAIADAINKVTHGLSSANMVIPALSSIIGGIKGFKNYTGELELSKYSKELSNSLGNIINAGNITPNIERVNKGVEKSANKSKGALNNVSNAAISAREEIGGIANSTIMVDNSSKGFGKSAKGLWAGLKESGRVSAEIWKNSEKGISGAGTALAGFKVKSKDAFKEFGKNSEIASKTKDLKEGVNGILKGAASGLAIGAVMSAAQWGISKLYDKAHEAENSHAERLDKRDSINQVISDLEYQKSSIKDLGKEYDTLAKKKNKSAKETERLTELKNQIAEIAPDLKIGEDSNGNAILAMSENADGFADSLQNAIDKQKELLSLNNKNLANDANKMAKSTLEDQRKSMQGIYNAREEFDKSFEGILMGGDNHFSEGYFNNRLDKFRSNYKQAAEEAQAFHQQLVELNSEIASVQISKLIDNEDGQFGNYAKATDKMQGKINAFANKYINWEKLDTDPKRNQMLKGLDVLAGKLETGRGSVSSFGKRIEDMHTNFNASGDMDAYNKDLEAISKNMSKITGIDQETIKSALDFGRYDMDLETENLAKYLSIGKRRYTDLQSSDKNIKNQAESLQKEFQSIKNFADNIDMGTLTVETAVDWIIDEEDMNPKLKALTSEYIKDGKLEDWEVSRIIKVTNELANGDAEGGMADLEKYLKDAGFSDEDIKELELNPKVKLGKPEITSDSGGSLSDWMSGAFGILGSLFTTEVSAAEVEWNPEAVLKISKDLEKPEKITKKWEVENIVENKEMPTDLRKFGRASIADGEVSKIEKRVQIALVREYQEKGGLDEATQKALSQLEQIQLGNVAPTEIKAPIKIAGEVVSVEDLKQMAEEAMQKKEMGELEYHALIKTLAEVEGDSSVGQKVEDTVKGETEGVEYEATPTVNVKPKTEGSGLKDFLGKIFGQESFLGEGNTISVDADTGSASGKLSQLLGQAKQLLGKTFHMSIIAHTSHAYAKVKAFANQVKHLTGKTFHVSIIAHTSHAYSKIKAFTSKIKGLSKKTFHMSLIAHTAGAYAKINASLSKAKQWAGKTFHASFIAHTAHAHSKISALLSKARQWNGHTFHASFIAHTAHAYAKVSSLLSLAQSFGGRTFHASMTVTKTINTIHKGKRPGKGATTKSLSEPIALNEQANTPMVASDTPTVLADEPIRPIVRTGASTPALFGLPYTGNGSIQDAIGGISDSIGDSLKDVENKVIQTIHGIQSKAISLADAVKNGTIVTLTPITKTVKDILDCLKFDIDRLKELENAIKKVSNVIDYTDKKLQHSVGSGRIALLQKENNLLVERLKLNEQMIAQKKRERDIYKTELKKKGLKFGEDGNIKNYEETMLKYKRELEKLEKSEEKASDSSSKKNEKRKKELEEIIKMMEKFLELVFTEIPDLDSRKLDDSNKYQDNLLEINKINHEKWVVEMESHWKNINKEVQKLTNKLDMLDVKMKHAWGSDKLQMMNQQIEVLRKSQSAYQDNLNALKHAQGEIQDKLKNYGFKFKANGDIEDFVATMNKLKDSSEEFDTIQKLVDGYFQVYLEDIPKAERELAEFQNKIKDVYKEQLEATKALEDQIIEMYKKELEEKKKMIDEELEHKLDALEKEKKAYDRMREEQKYNDDFNEQADKVKELEKQIEYAQKDTTLVGQKRLKTLLKQLEEEKKKLDKITQDRIDKQVGDSFDDEKDRLEDKAETEKKDLDEKYTDQELLEMAQNAIKNGMFVGIDGEVKSLQDALVEYINKWGDGLSATGAIIKSELITKLEIATQIAKEYSDVLGNLGVGSLDQNNIYGKGGKDSIPKVRNTTSSINYNAPLVNIAGDVTDNNIGQIREIAESVVRENNQRIIDNI